MCGTRPLQLFISLPGNYPVDVEQQKTALFEHIFFTTKDKVYAFIKGMVHDHTQVQDYMQNCYLKLWEVLDSIDTTTEVLPFLYTISRNMVIDHLRKSARVEYTEDIHALASQLPGHNNTEYYLAAKESTRQVQELLALLPERRRQVFQLIRLEGMSHKEVARLLKISVSTVEKHMHESYKTISSSPLSKAFVCLMVMSYLP